MSKPTPGPWEWDGDTITPTIFRRGAKRGGAICEVDQASVFGVTIANARLIAAAPDLLAACEECAVGLERAVRMYERDKTPISIPTLTNRIDALCAAIAKAKGEA